MHAKTAWSYRTQLHRKATNKFFLDSTGKSLARLFAQVRWNDGLGIGLPFRETELFKSSAGKCVFRREVAIPKHLLATVLHKIFVVPEDFHFSLG